MLVCEFQSTLDINIRTFYILSLLISLFLPRRGFPWRILRRRGCLWTSPRGQGGDKQY